MTIGAKLYRTATTDDSMAWAKQNMAQAPDGTVFLADITTTAKGRQGRSWQIYPGQLLVTFILKPPQLSTLAHDDIAIRLNQLTMAMALGIVEPLKPYDVGLKWPNDFVAQDKKVGGMLVQVIWHNNAPYGIIVGFALNVNNVFAPEDQLFATATSLSVLTQSAHEMRPLYKNILQSLNHWYDQWQQGDYMAIYRSWRGQQRYIGQSIKVHQKDGTTVVGIAQQVLPNGDIMLKDVHNKQHMLSLYQVEDLTLL